MAVELTGTGTYAVTIERPGGWYRQLASGLSAVEAEALARLVAEREAAETGDEVADLTGNTLAASGSLVSWVEEETWGDCLSCGKPVVDASGPWSFVKDTAGEERVMHAECRQRA